MSQVPRRLNVCSIAMTTASQMNSSTMTSPNTFREDTRGALLGLVGTFTTLLVETLELSLFIIFVLSWHP